MSIDKTNKVVEMNTIQEEERSQDKIDSPVQAKSKKNKSHSKTNRVTNPSLPTDNSNPGNILLDAITHLTDPTDHILNFETEVIHSELYDPDPHVQISKIVKAFNGNNKSIMTQSLFGKRIEPDEFRLVSKNNVPELVPPTKEPMRKQLFPHPTDVTEEHGIFKQTQLCIGADGVYLINVPQGKFALVWKGNMPKIYGPGPHVISDPNFRVDKLEKHGDKSLVSLNEEYIKHGTYHIIRVSPGNVAKVKINTNPYFLVPRKEPYVFNNAVFEIEQPFTKLTERYISHANYHILQIPYGMVAKVWRGSIPELLEANDEPYIFDDPSFILEKPDDDNYYVDATKPFIQLGSIKRIMPETGTVAITYDNGKLNTFGPRDDGKPTIINSANHKFVGFLDINTQTIEFPSKRTRTQRKEDNTASKKDGDYTDPNYEVFRTSDGLPIGVKLLVVYEITDPTLTITRLKPDQIVNHIEHLVVADMGMVIQNCSSVDFLKTNQTIVKQKNTGEHSALVEFYEQLQDKVKNQLGDDFSKYGIKLVRLNIETPKILDNAISAKMAEFALINSESRAKESNLERNYNITRQQASQDAMKKQIEQDQINANKISASKAEMESAELQGKAKLLAAKFEADSILAKATAEAKAKELLIEVAEKQALLYDNHPGLLTRDLAEIQERALKGINTMILSPDTAVPLYFSNLMPKLNTDQTQNIVNTHKVKA